MAEPHTDTDLHRHLVALGAGSAVALGGALVLLGWALDIAVLKSILPTWTSMKANTALCFVLLGAALVVLALPLPTAGTQLAGLRLAVVRLCATVAGTVGLLTLAEITLSWQLGIDNVLVREALHTVGTTTPGRMAPETALCFAVLGIALVAISSPRVLLRFPLLPAGCALLAGTAAFAALTTYLVPSMGAFGWFGETLMAVHTGVLFLTLSVGVLAALAHSMPWQWALNRAATVAMLALMALLVTAGLTTSRAQNWQSRISSNNAAAMQLGAALDAIELGVLLSQNATRGYVISGDEREIRGLEQHRRAVDSALRIAQVLEMRSELRAAATDPANVANTARSQLDWHRQVVQARRDGASTATLQGMVSRGSQTLEKLRETVERERRAVASIADRHQAEALSIAQSSYSLLFGLTLLGVVVLLGLLLRLNQSEARRQVAQAELHQYRDQLELQVQLRTAELQKALEASRTADRAKDAFLATMSHELRTPLNAVIGMAYLAQNARSEAMRESYLTKIAHAGKHLGSVINDVLDLSKIAAGHLELQNTAFSLRQVLAGSRAILAHLAAEKGLELAEELAPGLPDALRGDAMRVQQVIVNLASNAIKFTQAGKVVVRISEVARQDGRVCVAVEVEDTGIGMPSSELERIFLPFTQVDSSTSRPHGGTGLGLAITRQLVQAMGGDVTATSQVGKGSTFRVQLWLGLGDPAHNVALDSSHGGRQVQRYRDARVLVVDDQALNRELVTELLSEAGIAAEVAENGQQAVDILTATSAPHFDLVLMDVQMPTLDGLAATRALRSRPELAKLPIVGLTAHTMEHEKQQCADAGMWDHIGKPFEAAAFTALLAKWLPVEKREVGANGPAASGAAKPEALARLRELCGVDIDAALARFLGNQDRYLHWLDDFVAKSPGVVEALRNTVAAGDLPAAALQAHTFKGAVGVLGMTGLHRTLGDIEADLRHGVAPSQQLAFLEQSIGVMRTQIMSLRAGAPGNAAGSVAAAA